jgi:hypothetical protein
METKNSTSTSVTLMSARRNGVGRGSLKGGGNQGPTHQRHENWE